MAQSIYKPGIYQPGIYTTEAVTPPPGPTIEPGLVPATLVFAGPEVTGGATPFGTPNLMELGQP